MAKVRLTLVVSLFVVALNALAQTPCNWTAQTGSVVETCGNVGIGTTSPQQKLDVRGLGVFTNTGYTLNGDVAGTRLFSLDTGSGRAGLVVANGGSTSYTVKGDPLGGQYGGAGIVGSAADTGGGGRHLAGVYGYTLFNVAGTNTNTANIQTAGLFISELGTSVTDYRSVQYGVYALADARPATGSSAATQVGILGQAFGRSVDTAIGAYLTASGGASSLGLKVTSIAAATNNYAIYSDALAQSYIAGNLGIGIVPTAKLHVAGNVVVTGDVTGARVFNAVYQDLAEWVPAAENLEPGTVVVLDPTANNQVMASGRAYDSSVAGVVSAQPGVLLGVAAANKEQIATTGRVRVRVDARSAPIAIGDLLVTSDKPGTAMKSQPVDLGGVAIHRPGTIIGKALEALPGGEGEILVLLSLQ